MTDNNGAQTHPFEQAALERLQGGHEALRASLRQVIVGQDAVIESLMILLFSGAHGLITGAPGLAKTRLIRALANLMDLQFKRIQFTPDLMPSDILGTELLEEDHSTGHRAMKFVAGPVFTNILLADEINRTPPKTQAALLEAMEEKQVTVAGRVQYLNKPFFVFATQNPIELEGTYPLPEAQLDRFMLNIHINYLSEDEELAVATRMGALEDSGLTSIFSGEDLLSFARLVRLVPVAEPLARYAVRLVQSSRPGNEGAPAFVKEFVGWGAGTRGSQNLILAAKARALLHGRVHVALEDLQALALPVLRHRVLTNFRAEAERVTVAELIKRLIEHVPAPTGSLV
ncbi:MAG: MoxR family ATPase [Candidatus Hydrogenedentes bacterium]|nr:MoxR family ATPase [Candidatus Hydrogenedentota bacterium]